MVDYLKAELAGPLTWGGAALGIGVVTAWIFGFLPGVLAAMVFIFCLAAVVAGVFFEQ